MIEIGKENPDRRHEYQLQKSVCNFLDWKSYTYVHVANERMTTPRRGAFLKSQGVKSGFPDLLIFEKTDKYKGIALELKTKKNKPTPSQLDWLMKLEEKGFMPVVGYNIDVCDFLDEVINAETVYPYISNNNWISVDKELPPMGLPVWLYNGNCFAGARVPADEGDYQWAQNYNNYWHNGHKWCCDSEVDDDYGLITHWASINLPVPHK